MSDPLLSVEDLEKYYYEQDTLLDRLLRNEPTAVQAVDGVSFEIREGETLGLVGESGCGKSTTGETLLRLREPTGGRIEFDGENVGNLSGDDLTAFRRRAGIVFQDPFSSLNPRMTVGEIVREPLEVHDIAPADRDERVEELFERVGLSVDQLDRYPHEFSGGQQQRVGIARALAMDPELMLFDEPTSALDPELIGEVLSVMRDLAEEGMTMLVVTHEMGFARQAATGAMFLDGGRIVERGPPEQLFESPTNQRTKTFLNRLTELHDTDV